MAVNIRNVAQAGLLSQQYPPPLLPKPGKENVRLQKLLKKAAKKKVAPQASQPQVPFRSSLSPVTEASPDLEHSEHSTPPKTPDTPILGSTLHPRFNVRPLYQHSASPYPQHGYIPYTQPARFSPQPYVTPLFSHTIPAFPAGSSVPPYTAATITVTSVPSTAEIIRPSPLKPDAAHFSVVLGQTNNVLETKMEAGLIPTFIISKAASPQPSKPMFEVPQITNYTSKTATLRTYYTSSPTMMRSRTPISEVMRGPTPTFEVRRIVTPTSELKRDRTPTREIKRVRTPTSEVKRGRTPTFEITRDPTPTIEIRNKTPTREIKRVSTPISEIKRGVTPTSEIKRTMTPTSEIRSKTPSTEIKGVITPKSEIKTGVTPTLEITRVTTPTLEVKTSTILNSEAKENTASSSDSKNDTARTDTKRGRTTTRTTIEVSTAKTLTGRPKTPSHHVSPARTPVIEISRPNPLLFAVCPVYVEGRRSKTPTSSLLGPSDDILKEPDKMKSTSLPEVTQNGEVYKSPETSEAVKLIEHDLPKPVSDTAQITETKEIQGPMTKVLDTPKGVTQVLGSESPKTPKLDVSKPTEPSQTYHRPSIPPFAGQRPRTPKSKSRSKYYGLTPAEYVAYGGIQSFTPAFGISKSTSELMLEETTQNEQSKAEELPSLKPEQESQKTLTVEILSADIENGASVKGIPANVPETKMPTEEKLTIAQESSTLDEMKIKEHAIEPPKIQVPIIVVSKVDTPPSEAPKTVTNVSQRVGTPTYDTPKTKPSTPDSLIKTTEAEQKPKPLPENNVASDQNANKIPSSEKAVGSKISTALQKNPEPQLSLLGRIKSLSGSVQKPSEKTTSETTESTPLVIPNEGQKDKQKPGKDDSALKESIPEMETTVDKEDGRAPPSTESQLKLKPKGLKSKLSGWSRLKKHLVVEVDEPKFPESQAELKKEATEKPNESKEESKETDNTTEGESNETPRAAKMWDAILFQMFSTKESIMQQIEANKTDDQKKDDINKPKDIPTFAHRLPVLLYSPRFDARRLREAASRPVTKIATVFEMGLIGRKNKEEEPKDFNRTAKGFGGMKNTDV